MSFSLVDIYVNTSRKETQEDCRVRNRKNDIRKGMPELSARSVTAPAFAAKLSLLMRWSQDWIREHGFVRVRVNEVLVPPAVAILCGHTSKLFEGHGLRLSSPSSYKLNVGARISVVEEVT